MSERGSFDFVTYLKKGFEIVKLNRDAAVEVSRDEKAFGPALIVLAIGGVAVAIGASLEGVVSGAAETLFLFLFAPVLNIIIFSLFIAVFHGLARLFGGHASFQGYYRAAALASIVAWAQAVPKIGAVIAIWSLPVNVVILESVHGLKRLEAVAATVLMMGLAVVLLFMMGMLG